MKKTVVGVLVAIAALGMAEGASAAVQYDQNLTGGVIFGSGNADGFFTTDRENAIELGLRGKLRYDANGNPQNIFNSDGAGTYSFDAGAALDKTTGLPFTNNTAVWSIDWSINSDYLDGSTKLNAYTYVLGLDTDPTAGESFTIEFNPLARLSGFSSFGNNSTTEDNDTVGLGYGIPIFGIPSQATLHNKVQNSWKTNESPFFGGFDPTVAGIYSIYLAAYSGSTEVARTQIEIAVGQAVVPVPGAAGLGLLGLGLVAARRRFRKAA